MSMWKKEGEKIFTYSKTKKQKRQWTWCWFDEEKKIRGGFGIYVTLIVRLVGV